jgi:hypothetical protein
MLQGGIVTAHSSLGGWLAWVKMSRGRIVGGRIVKAPQKSMQRKWRHVIRHSRLATLNGRMKQRPNCGVLNDNS